VRHGIGDVSILFGESTTGIIVKILIMRGSATRVMLVTRG
jgi:hypothetical protein